MLGISNRCLCLKQCAFVSIHPCVAQNSDLQSLFKSRGLPADSESLPESLSWFQIFVVGKGTSQL